MCNIIIIIEMHLGTRLGTAKIRGGEGLMKYGVRYLDSDAVHLQGGWGLGTRLDAVDYYACARGWNASSKTTIAL